MDVGRTLKVASAAQWRAWLARHHDDTNEVWLVYNKKSSGRGGITYEESVEEALCFGWVDGQIKSIDAQTYGGRFTPRKPQSSWAASNVDRVKRLIADGRMAPSGIATLPPELKRLASRNPLPKDASNARVALQRRSRGPAGPPHKGEEESARAR